MHTWAGSMHIDLSVFCTHMFYIVLWILFSPPDVNDSKILKEYFLVLNCGCGYAAKFDIAAKYSHGCGYNAAVETSKTFILWPQLQS